MMSGSSSSACFFFLLCWLSAALASKSSFNRSARVKRVTLSLIGLARESSDFNHSDSTTPGIALERMARGGSSVASTSSSTKVTFPLSTSWTENLPCAAVLVRTWWYESLALGSKGAKLPLDPDPLSLDALLSLLLTPCSSFSVSVEATEFFLSREPVGFAPLLAKVLLLEVGASESNSSSTSDTSSSSSSSSLVGVKSFADLLAAFFFMVL
mmetsp:Transcript_18001/g.39306  ORF Transcript_18001/g.39306 Transcript_18001/m.39306 type:complete len:212 (-) Transcript_18001:407-1042(-)